MVPRVSTAEYGQLRIYLVGCAGNVIENKQVTFKYWLRFSFPERMKLLQPSTLIYVRDAKGLFWKVGIGGSC